jgi:hemolysin activation/secretion protein
MCELKLGEQVKTNKVRLTYPMSVKDQFNSYSFYVEVPFGYDDAEMHLRLQTNENLDGEISNVEIIGLSQNN